MRRTLLLAAGLLALGIAACNLPKSPASAECKADADCDTGLSCLSFGISNNGVCSASQTKVCTKVCTADADCTALKGPNNTTGFTCLGTCGADAGIPVTCALLAH